ncbi:MAG: hypothetical protein OFPII_04870 [Osedax symbiont Rs1]|nr:MAG: hypothetical protein OFPII_04870 [Osedax symbiont Rs1]
MDFDQAGQEISIYTSLIESEEKKLNSLIPKLGIMLKK